MESRTYRLLCAPVHFLPSEDSRPDERRRRSRGSIFDASVIEMDSFWCRSIRTNKRRDSCRSKAYTSDASSFHYTIRVVVGNKRRRRSDPPASSTSFTYVRLLHNKIDVILDSYYAVRIAIEPSDRSTMAVRRWSVREVLPCAVPPLREALRNYTRDAELLPVEGPRLGNGNKRKLTVRLR
ncbi:hypothetical protein GWI33_013886 [Rhynchophorus ferrugineus]|uniref:Uncharacterized protein n=1 Tax=Rhynchophorus ferrugineus TaxID=354439 RepID=A0A834I8G8_RHYFE|nr:hypothetical protein GWI33_013886 [Rhynchophorus ferrugineus]